MKKNKVILRNGLVIHNSWLLLIVHYIRDWLCNLLRWNIDLNPCDYSLNWTEELFFNLLHIFLFSFLTCSKWQYFLIELTLLSSPYSIQLNSLAISRAYYTGITKQFYYILSSLEAFLSSAVWHLMYLSKSKIRINLNNRIKRIDWILHAYAGF